MIYPIYNKTSLYHALRDGNSEIMEFSEFITNAIEEQIASHTAESGILAKVKSEGTEGLSPAQGKVLSNLIKPYTEKRCKICSSKIPMNEVFIDYSGYCSAHAKYMEID